MLIISAPQAYRTQEHKSIHLPAPSLSIDWALHIYLPALNSVPSLCISPLRMKLALMGQRRGSRCLGLCWGVEGREGKED